MGVSFEGLCAFYPLSRAAAWSTAAGSHHARNAAPPMCALFARVGGRDVASSALAWFDEQPRWVIVFP